MPPCRNAPSSCSVSLRQVPTRSQFFKAELTNPVTLAINYFQTNCITDLPNVTAAPLVEDTAEFIFATLLHRMHDDSGSVMNSAFGKQLHDFIMQRLLNSNQVFFLMLSAGVGQAVGQLTIVSHQQQAVSFPFHTADGKNTIWTKIKIQQCFHAIHCR